jgi:carbonic anhydrase
MSCPDSNSPIDIRPTEAGKCESKCQYSFSYSNSKCNATINSDYIKLSYDNQTNPPVVFNQQQYIVKESKLFTPSLHSYSGNKYEGELIIIHTSLSGNKPLLVCVPIKKSYSSTSTSSLFLKTLVDTLSNNGPSNNNETVSIGTYNLNDFIPKKPFYSYNGNEPYQPCTEMVNFIVYHPLQFSISMDESSYNTLTKLIANNQYDVKTNTKFFFNKKGSLSNDASNDIYIDCQPVGETNEETTIVSSSSSNSIDYNTIFKSNAFKIFAGVIVFIIILYVTKKILLSFN